MINVIFTFIPSIDLTDAQRAAFAAQGGSWVQIPECVDDTFQAYVPNYETVIAIKAQLEMLGTVNLIGAWNEDGSKYGYEGQTDEEGNTTYVQVQGPLLIPFKKQDYIATLRDRPIWNETLQDFEIITVTEAIPVNKFAGMADRNLE